MKAISLKKTEAVKRLMLLFVLIGAFSMVLLSPKTPVSSAQSLTNTDVINSDGSLIVRQKEENACATCHEEVVRNFARTVHGKAPAKWNVNETKGDYSSAQTCIACHGDPTEHINSGGDVTKIKNPAKLNQKESVESCQSCHSQVNEHAQWRGSKHESGGLTCVSCHSPHHPGGQKSGETNLFALTFNSVQTETKLLKFRNEADTCFSCHSDVRKSMFQRSTHLFRNEDREQRLSCSACHEPHGSIGEKMMRTASINETCYNCHTEYRGPFLYEHAPVRENCASCHKPHGSNNTSLLRQRAPMLCQQCHIQGRHQTVPGRPNSAFNINRSCSNCHSAIHGSNHPSGINLMR